MRRAAALLLLPLCGCLHVSYTVRSIEQAPRPEQLQQLQPGTDDLGSCLHRLGAPHFVWEYAGDGMALGYAFGDASAFGLRAGYTFSRFVNVSFDWDHGSLQLPGAVLWFDADLRLMRWQQGQLGDLTRSLRRRPPAHHH